MPLLAIWLAEAGLLAINGTLIVEVLVFLVLVAILARWVYPYLVEAAENRQRRIEEQLREAERQRREADERLREVQERLEEARKQAADIIAGASRSADQLRSELRERAEEESRRILERGERDVESERQRAMDAIQSRLAELVVDATRRVVQGSLTERIHRELIEQAVAEVSAGEADGQPQG